MSTPDEPHDIVELPPQAIRLGVEDKSPILPPEIKGMESLDRLLFMTLRDSEEYLYVDELAMMLRMRDRPIRCGIHRLVEAGLVETACGFESGGTVYGVADE